VAVTIGLLQFVWVGMIWARWLVGGRIVGVGTLTLIGGLALENRQFLIMAAVYLAIGMVLGLRPVWRFLDSQRYGARRR
jgi:hypothetical protein